VQYSLNLLPLGGYVGFPDDDEEAMKAANIAPNDPTLLKNQGLGPRAAVISAGVIANILFAWLVLFAQVMSFLFFSFHLGC
jgi:membrane-associated protease RseP (regulator of RpoE activity)